MAGVETSFTNASLYMLLAALGVVAADDSRDLQARRSCRAACQALAEMLYEFVANTVRQTAGKEGMKFFPFVFTLFAFILIVQSDRARALHLFGDEPDRRHLRLRDRGHLARGRSTASIATASAS